MKLEVLKIGTERLSRKERQVPFSLSESKHSELLFFGWVQVNYFLTLVPTVPAILRPNGALCPQSPPPPSVGCWVCLVSANWQEPGISKTCGLAVARFTEETNGYEEVLFPNIIWPFYWLQKVGWGDFASDRPNQGWRWVRETAWLRCQPEFPWHFIISSIRVAEYLHTVKMWKIKSQGWGFELCEFCVSSYGVDKKNHRHTSCT